MLLPESVTTIGCGEQEQVHVFDLLNYTGADGTFDLTYSVPTMNGFLSGPANIFVPNQTSAPITVTLTPNCVLPGILVQGQIDVVGNGFNDTATIDKTVVQAGLEAWEPLAPINGLGRSRPAAVGVNGKVYVLGGEISGGRANTVEEFDPATGLWTTKAGLMPTPASNVCAAAIGNDIYIPGGYDAANVYLNTLQVYHVDTDTWETIATDPLPEAKAGVGCATQDGKVYVYGGANSLGYLSTAHVYDPAAPEGTRWSALPNLTTARGWLAGTAIGGKVYAVGGRDTPTADFAIVEAYDPADGMWHSVTNLNFARGGPGAYAWGDNLVVCGGGWSTYRNTCEVYDTTQGYAGSWTTLPQTMITARRTFGYATLPEGLYATAGYNGTFLTSAERIAPFECPYCEIFAPDLSTSVKQAPPAVDEGQPIAYTIAINNTGNSDALDAMMTDLIPTGTTYAGGLTCSSGLCVYDAGSNTVTWEGEVIIGNPVVVEFDVSLILRRHHP
jgi:uncharacterized repeat protein (TIGR01451 family)